MSGIVTEPVRPKYGLEMPTEFDRFRWLMDRLVGRLFEDEAEVANELLEAAERWEDHVCEW